MYLPMLEIEGEVVKIKLGCQNALKIGNQGVTDEIFEMLMEMLSANENSNFAKEK